MFEVRDFAVKELVRLRMCESKYYRILDDNSNYSPVFKTECRELLEKIKVIKTYLLDILNNYSDYEKTWKKETYGGKEI